MRQGFAAKNLRHGVATTVFSDELSQDTRQLIPAKEEQSTLSQDAQSLKIKKAQEKRERRAARSKQDQ